MTHSLLPTAFTPLPLGTVRPTGWLQNQFRIQADFSGMVDSIPPEPLVIADVLHKAFIDVNDHGTEAAAVNVVIMEGTTAMEGPDEPIELRLDRPVLFTIRDTEKGALLFLDRLLTPEA